MAKKAKAKEKKANAPPGPLLYKVVELSNVDESSLEETINDFVRRGWSFDGVQFAMRESSKRPSMGFVFFTKEGAASDDVRGRDSDDAQRNLRRLASVEAEPASESKTQPISAWERLAQMADDED